MCAVVWLLSTIAQIIFILVLVQLVLGLLIQFDVVNPRQPLVSQVYQGVSRLLDPLLDPIRRILPATGGLDFSPLVLLIGLQFLAVFLARDLGVC